jgi:hypothetical protein
MKFPIGGIKHILLGEFNFSSYPSSAQDMNAYSYISTPPYVFMKWCLIKKRTCLYDVDLVKHRDNFTFFSFIGLI